MDSQYGSSVPVGMRRSSTSAGSMPGTMYTSYEPRPTAREISYQRSRPRSPRLSPRGSIGLACTASQKQLRNNAGEVFFPHAVRFDVPLGLNARPPGTPGTATEGRRRRVAHERRLTKGWTSPRVGSKSIGETFVAPPIILPHLGDARATLNPGAEHFPETPYVTQRGKSHTQAVTHKLSHDERKDHELQQIFHVLRQHMHSQRTLFGDDVYDARSLFNVADRDHSGTLDRGEFSSALHRLGLGLNASQIKMACEFVDKGGDDSMDYSEFILHLVVGDEQLEKQEADRRHMTVAKLRTAAWKVVFAVTDTKKAKSEETVREIDRDRIKQQKNRLSRTINKMESSNEHKEEAASLKHQASVLSQDGDYGGALATLQRAQKLTPMDPTIEQMIRIQTGKMAAMNEDGGAVAGGLEGDKDAATQVTKLTLETERER